MAVIVIPTITNWTVTPVNGASGYFSLMNTWLSQSTSVISSANNAIEKMNDAIVEVNEIQQQIANQAVTGGYSQSYIDRALIAPYTEYTATGGETFINTPDNSNVSVYKNNTLLTLGTHYTLNVDGLKINFITPLVASDLIQVYSFKKINAKINSNSGVRQTVQEASRDSNGFANFISIGTGLSVNISASTPIVINAAGGSPLDDRIGIITADKSISSLPANSTIYFYEDVAIDRTCTSGFTTLAPIYQFGGTISTVNGQFTFDVSQMKGYLGNGTTANQVFRTFTGEAVTNASTVTSVVTYALNGYYRTNVTTLSTGSVYSQNHNIGCNFLQKQLLLICKTSEAGYSVGDKISAVTTITGYGTELSIISKNTSQVATGQSYLGISLIKSGGTGAYLTFANWSADILLKRDF